MKFIALFLFLSALTFADVPVNQKLIGSVPFVGGGSIAVFADGSGILSISLPQGGANFDAADVASFERYFSAFEKMCEKVKAGNDAKFTDYIADRAFVPYMPHSSKIFVEATTQGTIDTCIFGMRLVVFRTNTGWGNDPTYALSFDNVEKLKALLHEALSTDADIKSKIDQLYLSLHP